MFSCYLPRESCEFSSPGQGLWGRCVPALSISASPWGEVTSPRAIFPSPREASLLHLGLS